MTSFHAILLRDHLALTRLLITLVNEANLAEFRYVQNILKTDAAELGWAPSDEQWLLPGQPPPGGWLVYEAAYRWCRDGFQRSSDL
ncbi:hypothetical protein [Geminicoccus harenae]|uniref:hypothetical protein n=1 Tax=Geminicoccus harenae TaxID=2498453 RepID=UPI00168B90F2|nr:hypothetical protein [Geminicoccus harenae]